jgi:hypothetical protein
MRRSNFSYTKIFAGNMGAFPAPGRRRKPGFPLQFLGFGSQSLRYFRYNPLRFRTGGGFGNYRPINVSAVCAIRSIAGQRHSNVKKIHHRGRGEKGEIRLFFLFIRKSGLIPRSSASLWLQFFLIFFDEE